ncbi:ABC transporter substrate-binding protein [Halotalea alkalilenta]|uniref:ABC transporter substrate-binding protein n=1 Tax=Halotalea alkalilenta TaxID=376489 RepID=UPI0009DFA8B0|nr:ABC transporter substrate-binding protein [Halotalea alkalilenta]
MFDSIDRRNVLRLSMGGLGMLALGPFLPAFASGGRVLRINTLAATAAVNVPMQVALKEGLAAIPGFAAPEVQPTARIPEIAKQVLAGQSDIGDADIASTLAAAEAGADVRILGLSYGNTSQVIVANVDRFGTLAELVDGGGTIAVSGIGDFMHVMLLGVLDKHGLDATKVNFIEMGSSGDRMRALLAGRVDAVPMHVEQAEQIKSARGRGTFELLVKPWQEYDHWYSAVVMSTASWLESDENKAAAVGVLKSVLTSFRRSNDDYTWYKSKVAQYASSTDLREAGDDLLMPVWRTLSTEINAFPPNMAELTAEGVAKVIPVYQKAGALKGTLDLDKIIDRSYLELALQELS